MTPKLSKMFPESCLLIFVGVLIGALLLSTHSVHVQPLTPDTFFLYMLPPIILDAGYFMPNRLFFDHLGTILLFAVVGTVFNTLTIGELLLQLQYTTYNIQYVHVYTLFTEINSHARDFFSNNFCGHYFSCNCYL